MDSLVDGRVEGHVDGCVDGLADGCMDGLVDGCVDRHVDGCVDGYPYRERPRLFSLNFRFSFTSTKGPDGWGPPVPAPSVVMGRAWHVGSRLYTTTSDTLL